VNCVPPGLLGRGIKVWERGSGLSYLLSDERRRCASNLRVRFVRSAKEKLRAGKEGGDLLWFFCSGEKKGGVPMLSTTEKPYEGGERDREEARRQRQPAADGGGGGKGSHSSANKLSSV